MKEHQPKTTFLKDYAPPPYKIKSVDLRFDLGEDETVVTNHMRIQRLPGTDADEPLVLDGEELELMAIKLNDEHLSGSAYRVTDHQLTIKNPPESFDLKIKTRLYPQKNTSLMGLYKSSGNFCTQCEAEGFRKITYFIDRPDNLSVFTTTIVASEKKYPVLLSNGNPLFKGRFDNGNHWVTWRDPYPKPSYLFALVAGDLTCIQDQFTTRGGKSVDIRFYTQAHNADQCDHAVASLKKAMKWDEDVYGREYDLDIYMVVAVDDFNMGAMENKGLNVFNSKYVLAKPETATDADFQNIEGVIGHEYFHNWSGNRITCRDWFQLSLKEGFTVFRDQEFSADMGSKGVQRISDVNLLRTHQFREDSGPMAHPVRPASYVEINNFYTMTVYNKGAEVVRMLSHLVGKEGFRRGTDLYFERHDGQAVTTDDFVKAIEDANGIDFSQFRRWYDQAGTPVVDVQREFDPESQQYTLTLRQHCPPTPGQSEKQPFHIPIAVGLLDHEGRELDLHLSSTDNGGDKNRVLHLRRAEQRFVFSKVPVEPIPSVLRGFSAPIKLNIDLTDEERSFLMSHDTDPFNRWEAGQQLALSTLLRLVRQIQNGETLSVNPVYVNAFTTTLLRDDADKAMTAQLLTLPAETYIAEFTDSIDPQAIHQARLHLRKHLAEELRDAFLEIYMANVDSGPYQIEPASIGKRALKNVCLGYLLESEQPQSFELAKQQFEFATNMTDEISSLSALIQHDTPLRQQALDQFYDKWKHDALVMDKWLGIQAGSRLADTLEQVKKLREHSIFSIRNPNKVRALIGAFCMHNAAQFHRRDGAGYDFLANAVVELDELNPQVAARLAGAFSYWRRYDEPYRQQMKDALEQINNNKLSKDVYEIVTKSLSDTQ